MKRKNMNISKRISLHKIKLLKLFMELNQRKDEAQKI